MKLVLVNPPRTFIDRSEIAPPLGLMRLARLAEAAGIQPSILDLNLQFHLRGDLSDPITFYDTATKLILQKEPDVVGFGSMAVDSHVAIHLARLIKEKHPEVITVLGGTHFSSIAADAIEKYRWIDLIVIGEGEQFIESLPKLMKNGVKRSVIVGEPTTDAYRPLPFELIDVAQYFAVNANHSLDFETGRGCRYRCQFCYSPSFYNGFRSFSFDNAFSELTRAHEIGFRRAFFVEDNFLNDPERAVDFCKEFAVTNPGFNWQAYATFPQLSPKVIVEMARAGCTDVFCGVDAIGKESRAIYKKAFVRELHVFTDRIRECVEHGIVPTCAFLLTPPGYAGADDVEQTLRFAIAARNAGAQIRLNSLSLYQRTGSYAANRNAPDFDDFKTRLMLDVPEIVETNRYAEADPRLFPFHSRYVPADRWQSFLSLVHCLYTLIEAYPATVESLWYLNRAKPIELAVRILDNTGPLLNIPKVARRDAQLLAAVNVLEAAVSDLREIHPVLELESERLLVLN